MHSVYEGMIALVSILGHTYTKRQMSISVELVWVLNFKIRTTSVTQSPNFSIQAGCLTGHSTLLARTLTSLPKVCKTNTREKEPKSYSKEGFC